MNNHNCNFCQQQTKNATFGDLERYGMKVNFCHTCLAEYVFYSDGALSHWSLYTTINEKMYRWTVNSASAWLRLIGTPGIPGVSQNEDLKNIRVFKENIPEINPSNISEKLRTYLLFL